MAPNVFNVLDTFIKKMKFAKIGILWYNYKDIKNEGGGFMEYYSFEQQEKQSEEKIKKIMEWAKMQVPQWIKEGEKYIYQEKRKAWRKCVEDSATKGVYGRNIETAIQIMKMLDEEGTTLDEVFDRFKKDTHLSSASIIVCDYSKRGPEFFETILNQRGCEISSKVKAILEIKKSENRQMAENEAKKKLLKKGQTQDDDTDQR